LKLFASVDAAKTAELEEVVWGKAFASSVIQPA